uniref:NADH-ubiquinone oxidoreductase chain 6 n=1 Tax=Magnusiomyces capitatus TaxID=1095183 RepID=A0A023UPT6_9ASCO|nr:NADH dehydrogenase subunit 6 [Magnusiomyces capitatus]AHY04972.1 NADH dehydrogenase subunit 6 [Magnusiomyces capitatus]
MWLMELMNTHFQMNNTIIILFEFLSMLSAICVMMSRNAMVSMMYLMLLYINVSIYLYFTGLGVMGLLYMLVYVGAMAMLFLFMLSLMNMKMSELSKMSNKQDILLITMTLMTLMFVLIYANLDNMNNLVQSICFDSLNGMELNNMEVFNVLNINWNDTSSYSELKMLGELLYTEYSMTMIIMGFILLLAMMGVMMMTK